MQLDGKEVGGGLGRDPGAATTFSVSRKGDQTRRSRVESNKVAVKCICTALKSAEHLPL